MRVLYGRAANSIPAPERYAAHKLLIFGERPEAQRTKANKDLAQAASLIKYLTDNDPESLAEAWSDLISRGPGWRRRAEQGLSAMSAVYPDLDVSVLSEEDPAYAYPNRNRPRR